MKQNKYELVVKCEYDKILKLNKFLEDNNIELYYCLEEE